MTNETSLDSEAKVVTIYRPSVATAQEPLRMPLTLCSYGSKTTPTNLAEHNAYDHPRRARRLQVTALYELTFDSINSPPSKLIGDTAEPTQYYITHALYSPHDTPRLYRSYSPIEVYKLGLEISPHSGDR